MEIRKMQINELEKLITLFSYHDVDKMIAETTQLINNKTHEIYGLFDQNELIGELHVKHESDDIQIAVRNRRAYLFAFRVHSSHQNKGLGKLLLNTVIQRLKDNGYTEFTIGVEDDNALAKHIYHQFGFNKAIARKQESYQGDSYEYDLLLKDN